MTVLVCAATRAELSACARGIAAAGRGTKEFETLLIGVGPSRAAASLGARLARGDHPTLVVSTGFAGGLTEGIERGAWVTASRLAELVNGRCLDLDDVTLRAAPEPALACTVISSSTLLQDGVPPGAEAEAPLAVDMESAALGREATRAGLSLMVLRLVSDTPSQPLPRFLSSFTAAMAAPLGEPKVAHAFQGVRRALADPRGVARIVRDGASLTRELAEGWGRYARSGGGVGLG